LALPQHLCKDYRTIMVIASEEELKQLGLEPGKPATLMGCWREPKHEQ